MVSVSPWGRATAAGAGVEGGLTLVLGGGCSEICFCPSNSEPGTARKAEREQSEFRRRRLSKYELVRVEGCEGKETVPS